MEESHNYNCNSSARTGFFSKLTLSISSRIGCGKLWIRNGLIASVTNLLSIFFEFLLVLFEWCLICALLHLIRFFHRAKHEVEVLAAVINSIARSVNSHTIVDVGSGQGYLAQVLSFQYKLSSLAIDGSLHHGEVTMSRAERIKKHYAANMRKLGSKSWSVTMPKTITCRVLSASMLRNLSSEVEEQKLCGKFLEEFCLEGVDNEMINLTKDVASPDKKCSLVLAGLHACGDLSVTMLRTCFLYSAYMSLAQAMVDQQFPYLNMTLLYCS